MSSADVEFFIARWTANEGGAERANYALFLSELCVVFGVAPPEPADDRTEFNDYVFERGVRRRESEGIRSTLRIDLYKKGCFILEAKQSRLPGRSKALGAQQTLPGIPNPDGDAERRGRRSADRRWDVMMQNARRQAEDYVFRLDADHPAPPFIIACDVGHCIELYADFTGTGRAYQQFPDRRRFRIFLEDLRDPAVRELLAKVWTDPAGLDPARETARVTRDIAGRLAQVSKALEEKKHPPEEVAHFLMRCIFTMFAQSVDLLPKGDFTALLEDCVETPASFAPLLDELWARMDEKSHERRFFSAFRKHVRHFNGNLFKDARAFPLAREEVGELLVAARADWTQVDPAIFGTLLEQALDPVVRSRLGAHYTPRAYVERLVRVTVMEPLRADWRDELIRIQAAMDAEDRAAAEALAKAFHRRLCAVTVLDPACGTGNFLYVALEMMKVLEGEVLEKIDELGGMKDLVDTVDPRQFLGLELNPRAAAIAELVVWIGWLQQHYRSRSEHPAEPILRAFDNINFGRKEGYDAVVTWDGYPLPTVTVKNGERVETAPNLRRPVWPEADFIIGNPPFIGGKDLRSELGDFYVEALWRANPDMNRSADFVMHWWDRAAELLTRKDTKLRRFGFITTNSISQVFQRRVVERHLNAKKPVSILFAVADHPWTKATEKTAAVRIAMTVAEAGGRDGRLGEVVREEGIGTDVPVIEFAWKEGRINSDLTVGTNLASAQTLMANSGLSSRGVVLHGSGFIVTPSDAKRLGFGQIPGLEKHVRPYRNGRDVMGRARDVMVIDLFGLTSTEVRQRFPAVYQHVADTIKPERDKNSRAYRRENWWLFGENVPDARASWSAIGRYITTVETSKHRVFQFLDAAILPDNMLVAIASDDAWHLAVLQSCIHYEWVAVNCSLLGVAAFEQGHRYTKSRCFDPFPFPDPSASLRARLRDLGEELDGLRKRVLAEHPDLTLTGLYNVVEKLKAGAALTETEEDVKRRGLAGVIRSLQEDIDRATAEAYGWPHDLPEEEILARLVALNAERAAEEAAGHVRWLRPDFQIPRFGKGAAAVTGELDLGPVVVAFDRDKPAFPKERDRSLAVKRLLVASGKPMDAEAVSRAFKGPWKPRLSQVMAALLSLHRYGEIERLEDGRYAARRAA